MRRLVAHLVLGVLHGAVYVADALAGDAGEAWRAWRPALDRAHGAVTRWGYGPDAPPRDLGAERPS